MNEQIRLNQSYANLFGVSNLQGNLSHSTQGNSYRSNTTDTSFSRSRQYSRSSVQLPLVEIVEEAIDPIDENRLLRDHVLRPLSFPSAPRYQNNHVIDNQKQENDDDDDIFAFLQSQSAIDEIESYYHCPQVNTALLYGEPANTISFPRISRNQKVYDDERYRHHRYHQHVLHQPCYDNAFAGSISAHMTTITPTTKLTNVQEHWINMWTTGMLGHPNGNNGLSSNKSNELQQKQQNSVEKEENSSYFSKDGGLFGDNHQQKDERLPPRTTWSKVVGDGRPTSKTRNKTSSYSFHQQPTKKATKDAITTCFLQQEESFLELRAPLKPTRADSSITSSEMSSSFVKNEDNDAHNQIVENEKTNSSQQQPRPSTIKSSNSDANGNHHIYPIVVNHNAIKRLSDSLSYNAVSIYNPPATSKQYPVVMLSNIPWNITIKELEKFMLLHPEENDRQYVHILIDKTTGKTYKEAFVEFDSELALETTMKKMKRNGLTLKGRKVNIQQTCSEQVFRKIFPRWQGLFVNGKPSVMLDHDNDDNESVGDDNKESQRLFPIVPPLIVESFEYESLLNICRNYKARYSRKCPERPFENFMSLMVKFPWNTPEIITTMQRDHLYEYYKLATATLRFHLSKPYHQINNTLMLRMVRTALVCPGLTVNQKKGILTASELPCPDDLTQYIELPSSADEQQHSA